MDLIKKETKMALLSEITIFWRNFDLNLSWLLKCYVHMYSVKNWKVEKSDNRSRLFIEKKNPNSIRIWWVSKFIIIIKNFLTFYMHI